MFVLIKTETRRLFLCLFISQRNITLIGMTMYTKSSVSTMNVSGWMAKIPFFKCLNVNIPITLEPT